MKSLKICFFAIALFFVAGLSTVKAQDEESPVTIGADIVSTYVWRGVAYGGPSIQPYVDFTTGGFSVGAWGSQSFDGGQEMDLYLSYGLDFGLSIGLTDYYYPGSEWFDLSETSGSHGLELNLGYEISNFSIAANYILNESPNAGTAGSDMYFEIGYSFGIIDVFAGAGDGWHSSDGEFAVCNVGVGASKEIKITEDYSLPVFGQVILNPDSEQFYIVAGFSF
ncbi:MAG: hypothetical protein JXA77_14345 [Bacteroidales bacterium]|nr:hypothetical protein [Bacteroidales bacterium]